MEFLGVLVEFLLAEGSHIADLPSPHIALSLGKVWRGLGKAWPGELFWSSFRGVLLEFLGVLVLGTQGEASGWLLSATVGVFIYVALVCHVRSLEILF